MIQVERRAGLLLAAGVFAALLAMSVSTSLAQTATHKKAVTAKPEPTAADLFEYIRGALLAYSPDDRINDNLEVSLDPTATVLTIKQPDGHCDIFLSALDANTVTWDFYDASDSMASRQPLARMSVVSLPGKSARICYDLDNQADPSIPTSRARLLFSWEKIPDGSGVQSKVTKAMKKLIALSGGSAEKDIFKP
jgi:hypothetical protein